ncbi:antibiotic biosynthesis monooxygenase family protein [Streptomyces sp. NPDC006458]|uniref:putative quinol monooxygenase n=1 Tax=Streptomyces sp. NPDC006458 TaxID=3154302 RepID=UPI0033BDA16D
MLPESKFWSSGQWQVKDGNTEEFVQGWHEFLTWTRSEYKACLGARLIQQLRQQDSFVSFASWENVEAMAAWQASPQFKERYDALCALCENVHSGAYELAVEV